MNPIEYVESVKERLSTDFILELLSYRYQWLDKNKKHIHRWDNALHYPKLKNFPHHIHMGENEVIPGAPTNIFAVLGEIAAIIGK